MLLLAGGFGLGPNHLLGITSILMTNLRTDIIRGWRNKEHMNDKCMDRHDLGGAGRNDEPHYRRMYRPKPSSYKWLLNTYLDLSMQARQVMEQQTLQPFSCMANNFWEIGKKSCLCWLIVHIMLLNNKLNKTEQTGAKLSKLPVLNKLEPSCAEFSEIVLNQICLVW